MINLKVTGESAFDFDEKTTCCFSGHRSKNLPGGGNSDSMALRRLLSVLFMAIEDAYNEGYRTFVTGMAEGIDLYAAKYVAYTLKKKYPDVNLVCVIPYAQQSRYYSASDRYSYMMVLEKADRIICLCENYTRFCMSLRNQYMVNHSSKLIAVVKDYKSGTGMTVGFARKKGMDIRIIDLNKSLEIFTDDGEEDDYFCTFCAGDTKQPQNSPSTAN